jgi:phosphatidate cytidylyltransferase
MEKIAKRPELQLRLRTAFLLGVFIVGALFIHPLAFLTVFGVFFFLIALEFNAIKASFLGLKGSYRIWVSTLSMIPFLISFYFFYVAEIYPDYLPGILILFALISSALSVTDMLNCSFASILRLPVGLVNFFYLGAHFAMLPFLFSLLPSVLWMLIFLMVIWSTDTFAYFIGKQWGRRKLYPSLSVGKTRIGFLGGLCGAVLMMVLFHNFMEINLSTAIISGLFLGLLVSIGDLVESRYKRLAGVKDSGNSLPGHGGFYDRFDAFIFILPYLVLFLLYLE